MTTQINNNFKSKVFKLAHDFNGNKNYNVNNTWSELLKLAWKICKEKLLKPVTTGLTNLEAAAKLLKGKIWRKGNMLRVYLAADFKRGQKAYIAFDEELAEFENFMEGATLKVFTDTANQAVAWKINASKQCKHRLMQLISKFTKQEVCATWQQVIL